MSELQAAADQIIRRGPDRVIYNSRGDATTPLRARNEFGIVPDIVFIRDDGWTLGAPAAFRSIAHRMWKGRWIGFMRRTDVCTIPIRNYSE